MSSTSPDHRTRQVACTKVAIVGMLTLLTTILPSLAPVAAAESEGSTIGWESPVLIETSDAGDATVPQVAVDGSGNALVIWQQFDGTRYGIWANRFVAASGWSAPTRLDGQDLGGGANPEVTIVGDGDAMAVWEQYNSEGRPAGIWARLFQKAMGWQPAVAIGNPWDPSWSGEGSSEEPHVADNGGGNAVAVWSQYNYTEGVWNIWSNRYVAGVGWGAAERIEGGRGHAVDEQVAADGRGNAIAVWDQNNGPTDSIWSNRLVPGAGWGTEALIETDDAGPANRPQVTYDGGGNATAVWSQSSSSAPGVSIWANRWEPAAGWGTPVPIEDYTAHGGSWAQVAADDRGGAVAVWGVVMDGGLLDIWRNRYVPGQGWGTAALLEQGAGDSWYPQVASDWSGNALVVWPQAVGSIYSMWAARFETDTGWAAPTLIETGDAGDARDPQVAFDLGGNAMAVWSQSDGSRYSIWANRYIAHDTTPPVLSLTSPLEGASTNRSPVWVAGITEPYASVSVNGATAEVARNGSFGLYVPLIPGSNAIVAIAADPSGNRAYASVNISFDDPVPGLLQDLSATQAALAAAQSNLTVAASALAAAKAELAEQSANVSAALERIAILQRDSNATEGQLAEAQLDLARAEWNESVLRSKLSTTQSALNGSRAQAASVAENLSAVHSQLDAVRAREAELNSSLVASQIQLAQEQAAHNDSRTAARVSSDRASSAEEFGTRALATGLFGILFGVLGVAAWWRGREASGAALKVGRPS